MSQHYYRVAMNIPTDLRAKLLRKFWPTLPTILARSISWAYRVPASFAYPDHLQDVEVYGIHRSPRTEALLCRVGDAYFQPLAPTRPLHLTLCTAEGVPPVEAGGMDIAEAELFARPLWFKGRLEMFALRPLASIGQERRLAAA